MDMEVVVPAPAPVDFNFDSNCSSPYMTAPSSPQRFGNLYFSAPASPTRISAFYRDLNDVSFATNSSSTSSSAIPFNWEEKPGTPKGRSCSTIDDDFEFDFSGQLERTSLSAADELFDGGKIRPLKPPPGYDSAVSSVVSSPRSPRSRAKNKRDLDPFEAAIEETRRKSSSDAKEEHKLLRGRERSSGPSSSSSIRKGSRSLSPLRVSDIMFEQEENTQNAKTIASTASNNSKSTYLSSILSAVSFSRSYYKKWKLKDLLLFRSASEGRAVSKSSEPLTKYAVLSRRESTASAAAEEAKSGSFRSTEGSLGGSSRRRGPPVSAHEVHYTMNRAASEEMRRKTFLPYKQGLLGCLGFSPGGVHDISVRGVGSLTRG